MSTAHTLEASGVRVTIGGRQLLTDVYLRLSTGDVAAVVGRNGSGKSTLMTAVYGTRPSEGSVLIDGVFRREPFRTPSEIRYLPQFSFLPAHYRVAAVLEDFGLVPGGFRRCFPDFPGTVRDYVGNLSGGWIRALETYSILRADSRFILLDEPFTHLSPLQVDVLRGLIEEERHAKGILLTDHALGPVLAVSSAVYALRDGVLRRADGPADLAVLGYRAG